MTLSTLTTHNNLFLLYFLFNIYRADSRGERGTCIVCILYSGVGVGLETKLNRVDQRVGSGHEFGDFGGSGQDFCFCYFVCVDVNIKYLSKLG